MQSRALSRTSPHHRAPRALLHWAKRAGGSFSARYGCDQTGTILAATEAANLKAATDSSGSPAMLWAHPVQAPLNTND